jgi:hypothetical protein
MKMKLRKEHIKMEKNNEAYATYEDEMGEAYFCPISAVRDNRVVSEREIDACVEASTAGRYSANLNVIDRFQK